MHPDFFRFFGAGGPLTAPAVAAMAPRPQPIAPRRPGSVARRALAALTAAVLLVAAPGAALAEEGQHTVYAGQTLGKIAKRYRITVDELREANGLKPGQRIHPGLVLVIPERGKPGARAAVGPNRPAALRREPERSRGASKDVRVAKERADRPVPLGKGAMKRDAKATPPNKRYTQRPKRPGWVRLVRGAERLELQLLTPKGRLVSKALPKLSRLMRASPTASIPIDPRLATLIGMVSNHFGGRPIRVVSGYRPYSPTQYTPHSNHNFGRAIDFMVEGVPNTVVRDFCRGFRNAGVGYYPNSTFVHLDVRSDKVYWVDYSGPGEPPRYEGARGSVAADEAARDVPLSAEEEVYGSGGARAPEPQPGESPGTNQGVGRGSDGAQKAPASGSPAPAPGASPTGM
ncbi:hypothetical protein SOCE26_075120 [Sorangium cellulosum]|uniref:Murein endopeptidase K n=1 Tax=Sorangium cellulosum TaxID=56 RepID=A0A2L0F3H4_SORCE|nr:DUF882 domain-containing protein [Sorangium cellulosum]AUX46009.1 hypothetical protein SOCE26_075120 [Sorangium cellulosum]